jgi:hypothetical protein
MPVVNGKRVLSTSVTGQWNVYYLVGFVDVEVDTQELLWVG